jgi:methionine-rich copper-binding protein CopC
LNARLIHTPTQSGTYTVEVGELGDNALGSYVLNVNTDDIRATIEGTGALGILNVGNVGVAGTINYLNDRDLFGGTLTAGTQYFIDLEGDPTAQGTLVDPFLRGIYDTTGTLLAASTDDDSGVGNNARLIFTPSTTGIYHVAAGTVAGVGTYRLFVRPDDFRTTTQGAGVYGVVGVNSPGATGTIDYGADRDLFRVAVTAGVQYYVDLEGAPTSQGTLVDPYLGGIYDPNGTFVVGMTDDDAGVGRNSRLVFTPTITGNYTVSAGAFGSGTGTYRLAVRADDFKSTYEGSGSFGGLNVGIVGTTGSIDYSGDQDLFGGTLTAGTQYFVDLEGSPTGQGTLTDPYLRGIYDAAGTVVGATADDDGGVGDNSRVVFTPSTTGFYAIAAGAYSNRTGTYRLLVRPDDLRSTVEGVGPSGLVTVNSGGSTGTVDYGGDQDMFRVVLSAGVQYVVDLEGAPTGRGTLSDSYLRGIYNPAGTLVTDSTDDDGGIGRNSRLVFTPTADGTYAIAAGSFGGVTGTYRLFVRADDFRSTLEGAGAVGSVNVGATGALGTINYSGDFDLFNVTLTAGVQYYVDLEGPPTGQGTLVDPYLRGIYDASGTALPATSNDDSGVGANARVLFTPTTTGTYTIEASAFGTGTGTYRLFVRQDDIKSTYEGSGAFGLVTVDSFGTTGLIDYGDDQDLYRVALTAGVQYYIDLEGSPTVQGTLVNPFLRGVYNPSGVLLAATTDDDSGVGANARLVFTPTLTGTFTVAAGTTGGLGSYKLAVRTDEFRSTFEGAGVLGSLGADSIGAAGTIQYGGDQDLFGITLTAGVQYYIDLEGAPTGQGTLADPFLRGIYNSAGTLLAATTDDDGGIGNNARLVFTPTATGLYAIAAGALNSGTGSYRLFVRPDDIKSNHEGLGSFASLGVGATGATGRIDYIGDQDFFAVALTANRIYRVEQSGSPTSSGTLPDPYLRGIYRANGTLLPNTSNDDSDGTRNASVEFLATATETYYLAAGAYGSVQGTYQIKVTDLTGPDIAADITTVGTIGLDGVVRGFIETPGDVDWYRTTLTAGAGYMIEQLSLSGSSNPVGDPYVRGIYNAAGVLLANSGNDDWAGTHDARVIFTPTVSGTYYIGASAYSSNTGEYRLTLASTTVTDLVGNSIETAGTIAVGTPISGSIEYARDQDWYRVALNQGATYRIRQQGAASNNGSLGDPSFVGVYNAAGVLFYGSGNDSADDSADSRVMFTPNATGNYYLSAGAFYLGVGTYRLSIEEFTGTPEVASNASSTATVAVGSTYIGVINNATDGDGDGKADVDVDWIGFNAVAGTTYRVQDLTGLAGATLPDPVLRGIYTPAGLVVPNSGSDDFGGTTNARVTFTADQTGQYFIAAGSYKGGVGSYMIAVDTATDTTAPVWLASVPADNKTGLDVGRNITLDFNEAVTAGKGKFFLSDGKSDTRTIAANDTTQVTFNGEVVTINPTADLAPNRTYSLTAEAGAVTDLAGNKFTGMNSTTDLNFTTASISTVDRWTLMIYVAADNDLEGAAIDDLNEMESVLLPDDVNVVVIVDRAPGESKASGDWTDTRRGQITFDSKNDTNNGTVTSALMSLGELNTGDPATLSDFVIWGVSNFPALNYGVVLWDHGGGLAGSAWDYSSKTKTGSDNLTILETNIALNSTNAGHYAFIGFDECLMAVAEETFDLYDKTDLIISAEETEPGDGWEYDKFLAKLAVNSGMSAMDLGASIVSTYAANYAGSDGITLSAIRTDAIPALDAALDTFCLEALSPLTTTADWTGLREAAARAHHFGGDDRDLVDLRDFMNEVGIRTASSSLKSAASAVAARVSDAVTSSAGTIGDAAGLSIYLPYGNTKVDAGYTPANYNFLNIVPNWDDFLAKL